MAGCFWTDNVECTEDCEGTHWLHKTSPGVFVPAVQGRDYRPYSKTCPPAHAPSAPTNAPPPTMHCQQVPIYGPGPSGGSSPSEGGSTPGTIIGYITVCA